MTEKNNGLTLTGVSFNIGAYSSCEILDKFRDKGYGVEITHVGPGGALDIELYAPNDMGAMEVLECLLK
jgi:hypothetical protein